VQTDGKQQLNRRGRPPLPGYGEAGRTPNTTFENAELAVRYARKAGWACQEDTGWTAWRDDMPNCEYILDEEKTHGAVRVYWRRVDY
jgi:hypothetical protein